ncbi:MAG: ABC transporter permease [Candidatus Thermoplasmatota archaeon]|nr:ABC transporter permease [Candidatus Thermoplasmatota archaeon]
MIPPNMKGMSAIFRMQTRRRLRNKRSLAWTILFPLAVVGVFAMVFLPARTLSVTMVIVDNDSQGNLINSLLTSSLGGVENINLIEVQDVEEGMEFLRRGLAHVVIVIPEGANEAVMEFLQNSSSEPTIRFDVYYRGEDVEDIDVIGVLLEGLTAEANRRIMAVRQEPGYEGPLEITAFPIKEGSWRYMDMFVPLSVAVVCIQVGVFFTSDTVAQLKESGVRKRLRCSPLKGRTLASGIILAEGTIASFSGLIAGLVGVLLFQISLDAARILALVGVIFISGYTFASMGYFVGSLSSNRTSSQTLSSLVVLPLSFFSVAYVIPAFFPRDLMLLAHSLPLSQATRLMQISLFYHPVLEDVLIPLLGLMAWGGAMWVLSVYREYK